MTTFFWTFFDQFLSKKWKFWIFWRFWIFRFFGIVKPGSLFWGFWRFYPNRANMHVKNHYFGHFILFCPLNWSKKRVQNSYQVLAQKRGRFLTPFFGITKPSFLQVFCDIINFHHLKYLIKYRKKGKKGVKNPVFTLFWSLFLLCMRARLHVESNRNY